MMALTARTIFCKETLRSYGSAIKQNQDVNVCLVNGYARQTDQDEMAAENLRA
jgi:hypothetical protein